MMWQYGRRQLNFFAKYRMKYATDHPFLLHFITVIPTDGSDICHRPRSGNMGVMKWMSYLLLPRSCQVPLQRLLLDTSREKCAVAQVQNVQKKRKNVNPESP